MKKMMIRWGIQALLALIFLLFIIRINDVDKVPLIERGGQTFEKGIVTQILEDNMTDSGTRVGEQLVVVRMTTGSHKGEELKTTSSAGYLFGAPCKVGLHVIVMQSVAGDSVIMTVYSQDREAVIYLFGILYIAVLVIIGGRQGLKGAAGLAFTFFAMVFVDIPMVYRGYNAITVAVFLCFITTLVTMYFVGGPTRKTIAATLGTVTGVVMAAVCAALFSAASGITGWNVSNTLILAFAGLFFIMKKIAQQISTFTLETELTLLR